jgi:amino acid transporter
MRLDAKREQELEKRKGLTQRTILAIAWLLLCFVVAYFIASWLFDTGAISMNFIRTRLLIPPAVGEDAILAATIFLIVLVMQFFVLVGFAFASPMGRRRPGTPTPYSTDPEPKSSHYDYR